MCRSPSSYLAPTLIRKDRISMDIYPTFLYIKKHKKTGLKYFGKTTKTNVNSYLGSGKYWKKHINKHGKEYVETIWISEPFYNKELLVEFSTFLSDLFDIEKSSEWANLITENGLDGAPKGVKVKGLKGEKNGMFGKTKEQNPFYKKTHSLDQKKKWREMRMGEKNSNYGAKSFTEETYKKLRRPKPKGSNYKGTPGKITCIDKKGNAIQINKELYNCQKQSNKPPCDWEYVNTNSKEAKLRKLAKMQFEDSQMP
jgi:hypothetical protein